MKTYIRPTCKGYEVEIGRGLDKLTVSHIYNGVATCYLCGSRAKKYASKAKAEEVARQIENGEIKIK